MARDPSTLLRCYAKAARAATCEVAPFAGYSPIPGVSFALGSPQCLSGPCLPSPRPHAIALFSKRIFQKRVCVDFVTIRAATGGFAPSRRASGGFAPNRKALKIIQRFSTSTRPKQQTEASPRFQEQTEASESHPHSPRVSPGVCDYSGANFLGPCPDTAFQTEGGFAPRIKLCFSVPGKPPPERPGVPGTPQARPRSAA